MNLSELIIQYRTEHSMSQREFSVRCGVSNGYMSMLENGCNPNTGKPLVPQIPTLMKIAAGMGMTLDDLLTLADDMPVDISKPINNTPALPEELGERIKQLRTAKGLTLEEVGNFVGVGKSTVRKWETGVIVNMRRDKISRLALILGISPTYLIGSEEDNTPALPEELSEAKRELIEIIKQMPDERVRAVLAILKG